MSQNTNAPDFGGAAQQQFQSGQQSVNSQTQANRPNISTSFGGQQWAQGPDGQWRLSQSLAPSLHGLQGQFTQQLDGVSGADANKRAFDAAYGQETSRLNPQFQQGQEQLDAQLANQGLSPGTAAYRQAEDQFNRNKSDAYQTAYNSAAGLGNQTQQMNYQQGIGGLGALHGFENGMPGFNAAGANQPLQSLDAANLSGQYGLQSQQMQNQMLADIIGGAGQLGVAGAQAAGSMAPMAAMASDERIKTNVARLPVDVEPGIPFATFKYKHAPERGHHLGVIAQDVERVRPDAVHTDEAGIKRVDYSKLKPFGTR